MNAIVFLDIDGCLTSKQHDTYFNADPAKYHPEKSIVDSIIKFCKEEDAKVLLSTNWRKFDIDGTWKNSYGVYRNPIKEVKQLLGDICIGTLPPTRHINKSQALILWFDESNFNGKYVIFDDDERENYQTTYEYGIREHFVKIDNEHGITDKDLKKAKDIFEHTTL